MRLLARWFRPGLAALLTMGGLAGQPAMGAADDWVARLPDFSGEATQKLQAYLRVDTTNPPGNEAEGIGLLRQWLTAEGIPSDVYESAPGRLNLVARLKGSGQEPPLLLLHHVDVVTADSMRWHTAPFGGAVKEGRLYGRGALDMKGIGIMQVLAFLELKRLGVPLRRDVILAAVADEEAGGDQGAQWLLEHHPEAVEASDVLNEGSYGLRFANGAEVMGIQTAERGVLWLELTAEGKPGHGSVSNPQAAPVRLIHALERLTSKPLPLTLIPESREMIAALGDGEVGLSQWVLQHLDWPGMLGLLGPRVIATEPVLASLLGTTVSPTVLAGGSKVNVVPGKASAQLDVRYLPGTTSEEVLAAIRDRLGDPGISLRVLQSSQATRSPRDSALYGVIERALRAEYPKARLSPIVSTGSTDSAYFRVKGMRAYGLGPMLCTREQLETVHGDDEFITIEQLARGTRTMCRVVFEAAAQTP